MGALEEKSHSVTVTEVNKVTALQLRVLISNLLQLVSANEPRRKYSVIQLKGFVIRHGPETELIYLPNLL